MTAPSRNENGRALAEASAPPVVADQGPSHHGDTKEDSAGVASRQVARFRAFLADYLVRYRLANGTELEIDESPECRRGCGRFAQYNGECFSCQSSRRLQT